jgi:LysR family transcriptional activator of nhaA
MVAREGSIARAAEELMLSQPTISVQLKELETGLRRRLFDRVGRGLRLTDAGRIAFNYANEIFSLGQEMTDALEHQGAGRPLRLSVGVLDAIPKPLVRQLLAPALELMQPLRLICREDKADRLLADLAARRTDMVLSDAPIGTGCRCRGSTTCWANRGFRSSPPASWPRASSAGFPSRSTANRSSCRPTTRRCGVR